MPPRIPAYRHHKARDCAVVTIAGRDHYLGRYDSAESRQKYHRLVAEYLAAGGHPAPPAAADPHPLTVTELVARYWRFARAYYVKDGKPTGEIHPLKQALRFLRRLYGPTPAREFTPAKLKALREAMIRHPITRQVKVPNPDTGEVRYEAKVIRVGLTRRVVNKQAGRVKRVFGWAVAEELVPAEVHAVLLRVPGLKKGRSAAREKARVRAVAPADVDRTLFSLPPAVRAMVLVQRLTGCRPQEVVGMRADEIDTRGEVWEYRPGRYKTQHHNPDGEPDRERVIFLGPQAQHVLQPFLDVAGGGFLFAPDRSEAERNARRAEARTTPPRSRNRPRPATRSRPPRDHYTVAAYRKAVVRACARAGVAAWSPNQLRHLRLTEIRRDFGLEASRVCGGHKEVGVTQVYAERDVGLARRIMGQVG